ncbi:unnamed protein product [Urochloa humidicola]
MAAYPSSATHQAAADDQNQTTVNAIDGAAAQASSGIHHSVEDELKRAAEKVEFDSSKIEAKVHRYPAIFRGLMSKDDRYFVPRCVAIGPYHHRAAHVQRAEEIKRAAAYFICNDSGHSAEVVYAKIRSVAGDARRCYDHDAVAGIAQADFATMMFQDACFLLQYILWIANGTSHLSHWFAVNSESIQRDIFLLENQVPWLVLDALMTFMPAPVSKFISYLARSFETRFDFGNTSPFVLNESDKPVHLLDLLRHYQSGLSVPSESRVLTMMILTATGAITSVPQSSSAIDLAEIGIQVTQNRTAKFSDMGVGKGGLFCFYNLFLAPLVMDDLNACWLLNMVALEASLANDTAVRSYVLLIAMLMNREEDVHELRVKRILHGNFSDQRTLSFFKDLTELIFLPPEYTLILAQVEAYRRKYRMWILLHKFIYNNVKYIVTVFSIIGVLVGIFKALFSIKQG